MLHALTSETKTVTTQGKSLPAPSSRLELHPFLPGMVSQNALSGGVGNAITNQQRQNVAGLQPTYGNQAILRTLHTSPQAACMIPLRPSQSIMLQRKCACGGSSEAEGEYAECEAKREGALQRSVGNQVAPPAARTVPSIVHDVLRSPGQTLDAGTRAFMEPRFGQDFSHVKVHMDARAAESARAVDALAYTVGSHIVFGAGQYAPDTFWGRAVMAHEFTHVLQQNGSSANGPLQIEAENDASEQEAHAQSHRVMANMEGHGRLPVKGIARPGSVQRLWPLVAAGAAVGTAAYLGWALYCLSPVLDQWEDATRRFIPWMSARKFPLPSKYWDAFGHCFLGCAGTKKCGATATLIAGQSHELLRELGFGGPHDSYKQDTNNQATGRGFGDKGLDCYDACSNAAATESLDLSAP